MSTQTASYVPVSAGQFVNENKWLGDLDSNQD